MTYTQYILQSCRKEKDNVYQLNSNDIRQLYNSMSQLHSVIMLHLHTYLLHVAESFLRSQLVLRPQHVSHREHNLSHL